MSRTTEVTTAFTLILTSSAPLFAQTLNVTLPPYNVQVNSCSSNASPGIQQAINDAETYANGATIYFPAGFYNCQSPLATSSGTVPLRFVGDGRVSEVRKNFSGGTLLLVQGAGVPCTKDAEFRRRNSVIQSLAFSVGPTAQSSGSILLHAKLCAHMTIRDVQILPTPSACGSGYLSPVDGILIEDSAYTRMQDVTARDVSGRAFRFVGPTGTGNTIETFLSNVQAEGMLYDCNNTSSQNVNQVGLEIDSGVSGFYATNCSFTQGYHGIRVLNSLGGAIQPPNALYFTQVLCDQNYGSAWQIDYGISLEPIP